MENAVKKGFIKGVCGKEEPTSMARDVSSTEPLRNEMLKLKKLYMPIVLAGIIGGALSGGALFAVAVLVLMVLYSIDSSMVDHKRDRLRMAKFKYPVGVDYDNLFMLIQPGLTSKYGMLVQKREDGVICIEHNNHIYDIMIQQDGTFTIWWRMSVSKAFTSMNKYKSYKLILADMGMIAYEIQHL